MNPPARGWPRRRRVHMFRRRASEKFACFALVRWRVHIFRPRASKGSNFVLGARRVHIFRPRVREGSCFSSSGAEGFAFSVLGRRRVHIFGSCAPKGSHFSSSCVEGFAFSARGWPRRQRVRFFSQATGKKSGAQKVHFPYVVSNKKRDFWLLAAIIGFGGPGVPEGSTFQWSVLRAAKKFEPSSEMVSKL